MVSMNMGHPSSQILRSMVATGTSQPPRSSRSHRSENSDKDLRENRSPPSKRRTIASWTKQIRVYSKMGVEGYLDDGYSWRKYGQKGIHGAKYPRGYYRCAERNVRGCMATKQVQRSDQDPTVFEINYRGNHSCTMASYEFPSSVNPENQEPTLSTIAQQQNAEQQPSDRVGFLDQSFASSSLHYPLTSTIKTEEQVLLSPVIENNMGKNFSCPYVSPSTSETTYFSVNSFRWHPKLARSGSEINDVISVATSSTNPPFAGLEFPFGEFHTLDGQNFTFDNPPFS
ncbi:hypothetical protein Fmac_032208 [Flemingia macrophylla]|uniref:WRKY domain-containing protein n=1 Tax=Flemingia macrophylla TaxID=520843 RepID=A0ABD1L487_9FABA